MLNKIFDIAKIKKSDVDSRISIEGWIRFIRKSNKIAFIQIYDGTNVEGIQCIFKYTDNDNLKKIVFKLNLGDAIRFSGKLCINPKNNNMEILISDKKDVKLISKCVENPLQKKEHSFEFFRTIPESRCKTKTFQAIFKIRMKLFIEIQKFFENEDYMYIHSPVLTINDAEGSGEVFTVISDNNKDFFDKTVYLGVSGQLYSEALAQSFKKVYTFAPTFRSDKSNTTKHAAEFWMLEPEASFASLEDMMDLSEKLLKFLASQILKTCEEQINFCAKQFGVELVPRLKTIINSNFKKLTYSEAIDILLKNKSKLKDNEIKWGIDLTSEHEKFIANEIIGGPVYIYNYPKNIKAFYMKQNLDLKTVKAMDLLVPGIGELIGGSERENGFNTLKKEIINRNMNINKLNWYLNLRKYGYAPSAGFGLGFERLIMYFTGCKNIRDVIFFPRTTGKIHI